VPVRESQKETLMFSGCLVIAIFLGLALLEIIDALVFDVQFAK